MPTCVVRELLARAQRDKDEEVAQEHHKRTAAEKEQRKEHKKSEATRHEMEAELVELRAKLAARAERRAKSSAAARKEIAEFTAEFLSAAREVFELMDEDDSGTLVVDEIVKAVDPKKGNKVANAASYDRAPFNLRGLRGLCDRPSRHHFLSTRRK